MENKENLKKMNKVLIKTSSYMSMIVSKWVFVVVAAFFQLWFIVNRYKNWSGLYILLLFMVLPMIFEGMIKNSKNPPVDSDADLFPILKEKYHYSVCAEKGNTYAFYVVLIMLAAWIFSYKNTVPVLSGAVLVPRILLIVYAGVRLLAFIFFIIKFKFFTFRALR